MFALVDCNNFYASCERVFNPTWEKKPLVVLSNNDGCVIARSNEAKAIGIPMGAPHFQWKDLLEKHQAVVCSSNFALYGDMSNRVMEILKGFSPKLQIYSIDEAFLWLEGEELTSFAQAIKEKIHRWTGIPVSIGMGKTKTMAKIAGKIAKKGSGVCSLTDPYVDALLDKWPVEEVWGIGRGLSKRLHQMNIFSAKQFRDSDDSWLRKKFSVTALRTAWELRGISCLSLEEEPSSRKSIRCCRSFGAPVTDLRELQEALSSYVVRAAEKARDQHALVNRLSVILEPHSEEWLMGSATLAQSTAYTPYLLERAKHLLNPLYQKGVFYRRVGVILDGLIPDEVIQSDFLSSDQGLKENATMRMMDEINMHFGARTLFFAAEGTTQPWKTRRHYLSPSFTTNWAELLTIKL